MDRFDREILRWLQRDATIQINDIAKKVGLTPTPCWRRIQKLEEQGTIKRRVVLLEPSLVNAKITAFVSVQAKENTQAWAAQFSRIVTALPEVVDFYRMTGDVDFFMRLAIPDIAAYHAFYKTLIAKIEVREIACAFALEQIKCTTELPLDYIPLVRARVEQSDPPAC